MLWIFGLARGIQETIITSRQLFDLRLDDEGEVTSAFTNCEFVIHHKVRINYDVNLTSGIAYLQ